MAEQVRAFGTVERGEARRAHDEAIRHAVADAYWEINLAFIAACDRRHAHQHRTGIRARLVAAIAQAEHAIATIDALPAPTPRIPAHKRPSAPPSLTPPASRAT